MPYRQDGERLRCLDKQVELFCDASKITCRSLMVVELVKMVNLGTTSEESPKEEPIAEIRESQPLYSHRFVHKR